MTWDNFKSALKELNKLSIRLNNQILALAQIKQNLAKIRNKPKRKARHLKKTTLLQLINLEPAWWTTSFSRKNLFKPSIAEIWKNNPNNLNSYQVEITDKEIIAVVLELDVKE